MKCPGLARHGQSFRLVCRVPADVRRLRPDLFPKPLRSHKVAEPDTRKAHAAGFAKLAEWSAEYDRIRTTGASPLSAEGGSQYKTTITDSELAHLTALMLHSSLSADEESREAGEYVCPACPQHGRQPDTTRTAAGIGMAPAGWSCCGLRPYPLKAVAYSRGPCAVGEWVCSPWTRCACCSSATLTSPQPASAAGPARPSTGNHLDFFRAPAGCPSEAFKVTHGVTSTCTSTSFIYLGNLLVDSISLLLGKAIVRVTAISGLQPWLQSDRTSPFQGRSSEP